MVNKKQSKRQRDIKTKLMAAICMLLVSSIMMVSTTYAWFTLSTAPEVTGITTAVGANGNLEMALVPDSGQLADITSAAGDSNLAAIERNVTWGNLVDLSDLAYGLDNITLYPAALNATWENGENKSDPTAINTTNMLKTPSYGADGRVSTLEANTLTGSWSAGDNAFVPDDTYRGVRAIGNASGMTPRQLSFRSARAAANTARSTARTLATQSLNTNGSALASIAIKRATDKAATYTQTELASLLAIVDDLNRDGGILDQIETAYLQYILVYAASSETGAEDTAWAAVNALVTADGATPSSVLTELKNYVSVDLTALETAIGELETTKNDIEKADTDLTALVGDNDKIEWDDLKAAVGALADMEGMTVNGIPASEVQSKINDLFDAYLADGGLILTMSSGGGVYADIADHCGDYEASITIEKLVYGNFNLNNVPATMKTDGRDPAYLEAVKSTITDAMAPGAGSTVKPITDMFGYVIDLAFRTNAAESNLMLQIDGTDRIYGDDNAPGVEQSGVSTWGNGSSMTFKATSPSFSDAQVKGLMDAVRIVFFDPTNNGKVLATAKLDTLTAQNGTEGWTAKMYLYELVNSGTTVTYKYELAGTGETATHVQVTATTYEPAAAGETATHILDADGVTYRTPTGDEVATHVQKTTTTYREATADETATHVEREVPAGTVTEIKLSENKLMPLTQNTAHAMSVLVYLDGNVVGNDDVAFDVEKSVTGSMNLQFASSANLVPMDYTPLQNQTGTGTATTEATTETTVAP